MRREGRLIENREGTWSVVPREREAEAIERMASARRYHVEPRPTNKVPPAIPAPTWACAYCGGGGKSGAKCPDCGAPQPHGAILRPVKRTFWRAVHLGPAPSSTGGGYDYVYRVQLISVPPGRTATVEVSELVARRDTGAEARGRALREAVEAQLGQAAEVDFSAVIR